MPFSTQPTGIYGLIRFINGFDDPVIRLVRASDSAQEDFGLDVDGFFDTDAFDAWIGASTAKVVTWYDQSGNGNHLTQGTDSDRPDFSRSGYVAGLSAVKFVRTTSTNGTLLTFADPGGIDFSGNLSFAWQWEPNAINVGVQTIFCKANGGLAGEFSVQLQNNTGKIALDRPFVEAGLFPGTGAIVGSDNVHGIDVSGTGAGGVQHYFNGAADGTDTLAAGTATSTVFQLGAGNFSAGTQQDPIRGFVRALAIWDELATADREIAEDMMLNETPADGPAPDPMIGGRVALDRRRRRARFYAGRRK